MERNYDGESISGKYYVTGKAVAGRLSFERMGMRFQGQGFNMQQDAYIPYHEMTSVSTFNSLGIIPNGIMVHTLSGKDYKFLLSGRKEVIAFLKRRAEQERQNQAAYTRMTVGNEFVTGATYKQTSAYRTEGSGYNNKYESINYTDLTNIERKKKQKTALLKFVKSVAAIAGVLVVTIALYYGYTRVYRPMSEMPKLSWEKEYEKSQFTQEDVDSETVQWFCAACAVYTVRADDDLELRFIGGRSEESKENMQTMQDNLANDWKQNGWEIHNRKDGIAVVEELLMTGDRYEYEQLVLELKYRKLLDLSEQELWNALETDSDMDWDELYKLSGAYTIYHMMGEKGIKAWDYCQALQVLGECYVAGYISLEECLDNSLIIAEELQSEFDDWNDVYTSYVMGSMMQFDDENETAVYACQDAYNTIMEQDEDEWPFSVPYDIELTDTWSDF